MKTKRAYCPLLKRNCIGSMCINFEWKGKEELIESGDIEVYEKMSCICSYCSFFKKRVWG